MKKVIILVMIIFCCLGSSGCRQFDASKLPLNQDQELIVEDLVSIKIQEIEIADSIEAPITSNIMSVTTMGYLYYNVKAELTNISQSEFKVSNISSKIIFEGKEQIASIKVESKDRTQLKDTYTLQPEEVVILYVYTRYSIYETNIYKNTELLFTINEQEDKFIIDNKKELVLEKTYVEYGENITTSNGISIDIQEHLVKKKIVPSNLAGSATMYQVQNNAQSFMILKLLVTNNSLTPKSISKLIGIRTLEEDQRIKPDAGIVILEKPDGSDFTGALEPGEQSIVYCFTTIYGDAGNNIAEFRLDTIDGTYYIVK